MIGRSISAALLILVLTSPTAAARHFDYPGCGPYPSGTFSPTAVVGCQVFGIGWASFYSGVAAARNDCRYPWTDCQPIVITSLDTGRSVTVTPAMYCDCYLGDTDRSNDRMVDLTPAILAALHLDPANGVFKVRVEPRNVLIPNTAFR